MYAEHVPIINGAMRASPAVFMRGCMFAILSARVQFPRVPDQMECVRKRGNKSPALWNWKFGAYEYLASNYENLHCQIMTAEPDTTETLTLLSRLVPGLGIVKGAFILQMLGHDIACLDVRNTQREGLEPRAYRTDGKKNGPAFRRKVERYVQQTQGRAEELWDAWCEDVAQSYGMTAEQISAMHVNAIVPRSMRHHYVEPMRDLGRERIPF